MENLSTLVNIGTSLGINNLKFHKFRKQSERNILKIQVLLRKTLSKMQSIESPSKKSIENYSKYIISLQDAVCKQTELVHLKSLSLIMSTLKRQAKLRRGTLNFDRILLESHSLRLLLKEETGKPYQSIINISVFELDLIIEAIQDKVNRQRVTTG